MKNYEGVKFDTRECSESITAICVPFLIANVLQALYGGADLFVVGQYDDSASVAAVAIGSQVMRQSRGLFLALRQEQPF